MLEWEVLPDGIFCLYFSAFLLDTLYVLTVQLVITSLCCTRTFQFLKFAIQCKS